MKRNFTEKLKIIFVQCYSLLFFLIVLLGVSTKSFSQEKIVSYILILPDSICKSDQLKQIIVERRINDSSFKIFKLLNQSHCSFDVRLIKGEYRVTIIPEGYKSVEQIISVINSIDTSIKISFEKRIKPLEEVIVKSKIKDFIKFDNDKILVSVANNPMLNGGTTFDALEQTPGVLIGPNGEIILKGKMNVSIWIDGQPSGINIENLPGFLKGLPAKAIEKFELISNPGAAYDAQGTGGIINIVMVHNLLQGFNGSLSLDYAQSSHSRLLPSLRLTEKYKKFNFQLITGYFKSQMKNISERTIFSIPINLFQSQSITSNATTTNPYILLNCDFDLNARTRFGGKIQLYKSNDKINGESNNIINSNSNTYISTNYPKTTIDKGVLYGAYLNILLGKEKQGRFSYNIDFLDRNLLDNTPVYETNAINGIPKKYYTLINKALNSKSFTTKSDVTWPVKKIGISVSAGLKLSIEDINNNGKYNLYNLNDIIASATFNSFTDFVFKQTIKASYITSSKNFKNLNVGIGLRVESTNTNAYSVSGAKKIDTSYTNVFPNINLNYYYSIINLNASYSKRIQRLSYNQLDQNISYTDSLNRNTGNLSLSPTFSNSYSFGFYLLGFPIITYDISSEKNTILRYYKIENGVNIETPINIKNSYTGTFFGVIPLPISYFYNPTLFRKKLNEGTLGMHNVDYIALFFDFTSTRFNSSQINNLGTDSYRTFGIQAKFKLTKTSDIGCSYQNLIGGNSFLFQYYPSHWLDIWYKQKLIKNKLDIRLFCNDIFNTRFNRSSAKYPDLNYTFYNKPETQRGGITIVYNFGKFKIQNKTEKDLNVDEMKNHRNLKEGQ
ncbi:outer membrane beta-barrel protein [Ferruginibacter sp.]|nr:outer membrane beta-barrel protein [Ferruginibacter sp.]